MGSLQATEMAAAANRGETSLDAALSWHLAANTYPPVPHVFLPTCREAIQLAEGFEPYALVALPDHVEWKDGRSEVEAWRIVESFHLDAFIRYDAPEDEADYV